jgi:hypothetical protein
MIPDGKGQPRPSSGSEPHWAKLRALQNVPTLYAPLASLVTEIIDRCVTRGDRVLDSAGIGAQVLKRLPSGCFGDFHRQLQAFGTGAEGAVCGTEIYRQLAERQTDRWQPLTKVDPRGVWDTMLYERV